LHSHWLDLIPKLLIACACISCSAKLPPDPGLATADLGVGIRLGMEPADATLAAAQATDKAEVWVLTRAELNTRNPYSEKPADTDLVVALYAPSGLPRRAPDDPIAAGRISELRCYLTEPANSRLRLLGQPAATLSQTAAIELCGAPEQMTPSTDGNVHLLFDFQPSQEARLGHNYIELVTSYNAQGSCFAFAITLKPRS